MNDFAVAIFGPTGVGKTSLSIELAQDHGEIISVDSMQVYKYMDIGTAKPSNEDRQKVRHHLIDIINPDIQFNVGDFSRQSSEIIKNIHSRGKIPFLVGGTGLYFLSLMRGMVDIPKIDPAVKSCLDSKLQKIGQQRMYKLLERLDYDYSTKIHHNDTQRTLRALEVLLGTGKKFSLFLKSNNQNPGIRFITIGINAERNELYSIINRRVDDMINNGLVDEVKTLMSIGYKKTDPGLRAIGYREIIDHFEGLQNLENSIEKIKQNSRNYAKRQITWFTKVNDVRWFSNNQHNEMKKFIAENIKILQK